MAYQHPDLVRRLEEKLGLSPEQARMLFADTKKFLYLCGTTKGRWTPTSRIDEGWHNFILFTKDYAQFCQSFFGRFIHHEPKRLGVASGASTLSETIAAAAVSFDLCDSVNWMTNGRRDSADCSKSGCNCSPDTGGGGDECSPEYAD